jgi:hypothetical protein
MTLIEIFTILLIYWFADFVLQTDWQAKNKSSNNQALLAHTSIYSIIWLATILMGFDIFQVITFITITFVFHTATDYFTSRLNSKLWKEQKVHYFFASIVWIKYYIMYNYLQLIIY